MGHVQGYHVTALFWFLPDTGKWKSEADEPTWLDAMPLLSYAGTTRVPSPPEFSLCFILAILQAIGMALCLAAIWTSGLP